jgi:hypothetical protein
MEQTAVKQAGGQEAPPLAVDPNPGQLEGAELAKHLGAVLQAQAPEAAQGGVQGIGGVREGEGEGDGVEQDADAEQGRGDGRATQADGQRLLRLLVWRGRVLHDMRRRPEHGAQASRERSRAASNVRRGCDAECRRSPTRASNSPAWVGLRHLRRAR